MRVLFCCMPAYGHLYPLLPLASALRDAGHDVRFGIGAGFVDRVQALGFPADPVGISIPEASRLAEQRYPGRPGPELGLIASPRRRRRGGDRSATAAGRPQARSSCTRRRFGGAVTTRVAGIRRSAIR
jgi:hypothetical protein